jgi:segregation and condensation protein B
MTNEERKAALEAIIYAADEPATIDQLATALGEEKLVVQASLDELVASYAAEEHGVEVRAVAGGYKMYTKPQQHDAVRRFIKSLRPPLRLTMPALETLAVIAYKQPVTAPEIQEIRGVNTSGVLKTLLDKRLITTAGRKEVIGRPILYRSSKEFLMRFGLSDLDELPSLKEFEALAREALGSDEGFAPSGAGDESVLDGMPQNGAAAEVAAAASEAAPAESVASGETPETAAPAVEAGDALPSPEGFVNGEAPGGSTLTGEPAALAESPEPEPAAAQPEAAEQNQEETAEAHKTATAGE